MEMERAVQMGRVIVQEVREQNLPFLAAGLAFYAFISVLPLLLLALIVVSVVAGDWLAEHIIVLTQLYLSPDGEALLAEAITDASGWARGSIIAIVVLIWASFRIFCSIDIAFAQLYGTSGQKSLGRQVRDSGIAFVAVGFGVLLLTVTAAVFAVLSIPFVGLLNPLLLISGLLVIFFPLYYVFPDAEISAREALPGTAIAAVSWTILESLFQIYARYTVLNDLFGILGGAIMILLWLYVGALVLLVGVVINVIVAGRTDEMSRVGGPV